MSRRLMVRACTLVALIVSLPLAVPAGALPAIGGPVVPAEVGEVAGLCDPLDPAHCMLPFPSDFFTVADPSTASGRRINFSAAALPTNAAGKPWDPTEWNRNDGFSPGTPILARVPNLDLHATWAMDADQLTDLSRSMDPDAPIVLLDATTGERHPFWSELDTHPDVTDANRLLIIRPARNLAEGHRYVVALRRLKTSSFQVIEPTAGFRALRDRRPAPTGDLALEARRPAAERVFADLAAAGVGRPNLYLAWDFTVASERNLTERVLQMRKNAFGQLGDWNLADGVVQGISPRVRITEVTEFTPAQSRGTSRTVRGTVRVPNYLTPQHYVEVSNPDQARALLGDAADQLPDVPDPLGELVGLLDEGSAQQVVPGTRLNYGGTGLPTVNKLQPTVDVEFDCHLPHAANVPHADGQADVLLYGHGLLGSRGEAGGSSTEDLRLRGFAICAVDWWGMSFADLASVATMLVDMSNFPSLPDRAQQGFINFMYLGRALAHPQGLVHNAAFRRAGKPLIRTGSVGYDGNSQGGIMGGALTALAPDFARAKLGVPGMNYSTLLNRSVDWEGAYAEVAYAAYPDIIDRQLMFGLIQMVWDRGEANGYAHHMTSDPLAGTRAHQVMLQVAYADHQVANVTAEVEARTIGARLKVPAVGADAASAHWSIDPSFGMEPASFGPASVGESVLMYWYSSDRGNVTPPTGNVPPTAGGDPHGDPRKDNAASDQVAHWLRTGELLDVCGGGPCVTTDATRRN